MHLTLPPDLQQFVDSSVAAGTYPDQSAVVTAAVQLLKREEEFRRAVQVGVDQLDRGEGIEYREDELGRFMADLVREAEERRNSLRATS